MLEETAVDILGFLWKCEYGCDVFYFGYLVFSRLNSVSDNDTFRIFLLFRKIHYTLGTDL